ncbi:MULTISPECIES: hypothetical protein [unclassified Streptomyces]|jgi:hypothetical protein|uniref:hypothetical protein n=1 Tax=unclassified Streptomyces TaxID=2593676 RepID=UPI00235B37DC|nr:MULTISPECIES: hypothetical protein [unclassified Streptomyces]MDH6502588.1 hypothetical protein [Streptomyces sp. SAI-149]GLP66367.1 hypothetical protein TUSST3_29870 [Streptomyces sp. TUS-ST3]
MASGTFQSLPVPPTALDGRISAITLDPDGTPSDVVKNGTPVTVQVEWHLTGFLVPLLAGNWSVRVGVDEIGGPHDFTHPDPPQSVPVTGGGSYRTDLVLTDLRPGRTYALIASLGYHGPAGAPAALGGYVDIGTVSVLP